MLQRSAGIALRVHRPHDSGLPAGQVEPKAGDVTALVDCFRAAGIRAKNPEVDHRPVAPDEATSRIRLPDDLAAVVDVESDTVAAGRQRADVDDRAAPPQECVVLLGCRRSGAQLVPRHEGLLSPAGIRNLA